MILGFGGIAPLIDVCRNRPAHQSFCWNCSSPLNAGVARAFFGQPVIQAREAGKQNPQAPCEFAQGGDGAQKLPLGEEAWQEPFLEREAQSLAVPGQPSVWPTG